MHPVNTADFGVTGMKINYNIGSGPVSGHIVKQISATKYLVAPGAITTAAKASFVKVRLARTTTEVSSLPVGVGTIAVSAFGGGAEHARKVFSRKLLTVEGHTYHWRKTTADQPGECNVPGDWFILPNSAGFINKVNV